jgi:hypothetical protein
MFIMEIWEVSGLSRKGEGKRLGKGKTFLVKCPPFPDGSTEKETLNRVQWLL